MPKQNCQVPCNQCPVFKHCKPQTTPKPYLNAAEQEILFVLGACVASSEEALREIKKRRNSPDNFRLMRLLRVAAACHSEAINIMAGHIPDDLFKEYVTRLGKTKKIEVRED
jgi:hypothetical protein